jgi:hypothetical protein
MAKQLGRWRGQDAPVGPRAGAFLSISPVDDLAHRVAERRIAPAPAAKRPARPAQHIHVHMPAPAKVRDQPRARTTDATAPTSGFPISDGDVFRASDCGDGGFALQRVRAADAGNGMPTDPEIIPTPAPGSESIDSLRRRMAPRAMHDRTLSSQQQGDQLRAMQQYLDKLWAPRS